MIDIVVTVLILYLLYKLIFDFIVPVAKTTSQFKSHVDNIKRTQEQMRKQEPQKQAKPQNKTADTKNPATTDAEYIDFEEVK
ncbi:hypothetical protein BH11BAC6_BH11BAC6_16440 [soil metagenome]